MKVKFLKKIKHQDSVFDVDDVATVDDETGAYFCRAGWATDLAGKVKTESSGKNKRVVLEVQGVKASAKLETK